jgi:hypothetical protein
VLNALKQYGMFLADIGMGGDITFSADLTRSPKAMNDVETLAGITADNFEMVDESSLILNSALNAVNPKNVYVKPGNSALLSVVDSANPANRVQIPIALQPVTVGTPEPALTIQAGSNPFRIKTWVNGSSNQNLNWIVSPSVGAGTIASDGTYTAPAFIPAMTEATLTASSQADSKATVAIHLTVLPPGPLRIDVGSAVSTVDQTGTAWLPDVGFEHGSFSDQNDWYPVNGWGGIPNQTQYQTYKYTWGDDIVYRFHVPNGNYRVALMFGQGGTNGQYTTGQWDNGLIWGPMNLEAQGQVAQHGWNLGIPTNYTGRKPATAYLPAKVTDTNLVIAVRALSGTTGHSAPFLNGITITPDASAAHLSVESQIHIVTGGTQLQLYTTDWYSGSNNVTWRIVNGPGVISSTGLYTAPLHVTTGQWVAIRALDSKTGLAATFTVYVPAPGDVIPSDIH